MEKIYCTKCNGIAVKNGFQKEIQRYRCKLCLKKFQLKLAVFGVNNEKYHLESQRPLCFQAALQQGGEQR